MTFAGNCNYSTPADGGEAMVTLLARLVAAGWAITDQSDGSSYPSTFPTTGSCGSGAWFAVEVPGAGTQSWCIQADTSGNKTLWRVKYATGTFTGGSPAAQVVPSATGEVLLIGGGSDATPAFNQLFAADGTYRWLVACDNAAPYGWHAMGFPTGGTDPNTKTFLLFDPLAANSYPPGDTEPFVVRAAYATASLGNLNSYSAPTSASGTNLMMPNKSISGTWQGCGVAYPNLTSFGAIGQGSQWQVEPYTGFEQRALLLYGRGLQGMIGYSTMVTIGTCVTTPARVTGDVLQVGADYFVRLDYLYVPWDSTPVVI